MTKHNSIPKIIHFKDYYYETYIPTVFKPFKESYEEKTILKKIRFSLQALRGSVIFYLKKDGNTLGYVVLEKGAGIRYPGTSKNDWIISPYTVKPNERGKGYGIQLLSDLKNDLHKYLTGSIYAEVRQNNMASLRAMEKADYTFLHYAKQDRLFKRYIKSNIKSEYLVYKA